MAFLTATASKFLFLTCLLTPLAGDYYRLQSVKRVDQDLYSAQAGMTTIYIQTEYCYHYAYGEDATLKYDQFAYDNKIIWRDDSTCAVKKVCAK